MLTTLACAAAILVVAGCGETEEEQAREVAQEYVDALNGDDFATICELYSDDFKNQLGATDNCEEFVKEQSSGEDTPGEFELGDVRVNDDRAIVDLTVTRDGNPVALGVVLEEQDGEWRVASLQ